MRSEEMRPMVEVGFYLTGVGMLDQNSPFPFIETRDLAGVFAFTIEGLPVNAEGLGESGDPRWIVEDLHMSAMLVESMTYWMDCSWVTSARCCYDYVELEIRDIGRGMVQIRSGYVGEVVELWPSGICSKDDLLREFDQALTKWDGYRARWFSYFQTVSQEKSVNEIGLRVLKALDPNMWGKAIAGWRAAYVAYQAGGRR